MKNKILFQGKLIWMIVVIILSIPLASCQGANSPFQTIIPTSTDIKRSEFEVLVQGNPTNENVKKPTIIVANNNIEAKELATLINDAQAVQEIQSVNYDDNIMVAVFRGRTGNSIEGIEVQSIDTVSRDQVQVIVDLTEPVEGQVGSDLITYPYQIILVPRHAIRTSDQSSWTMLDTKGAQLAEITPISSSEVPPRTSTEVTTGPSSEILQVTSTAIVHEANSEPFATIDQGYSLTAEISEPMLFVIDSSAKSKDFTKWLKDPGVVQLIQMIDYSKYRVVAVFRGRVGNSADGIQVKSIQVEDDEVQVIAEFTKPEQNQMGAGVIAYPYHIILISRDKMNLPADFPWKLYDSQGKLLTKANK